jgi:hypothetical protein
MYELGVAIMLLQGAAGDVILETTLRWEMRRTVYKLGDLMI